MHELHSEEEFEPLVAKLATRLIGPVIWFKRGPDEGRDLRFSGKANAWPSSDGLDGSFVLQAKHTLSETADCSNGAFRSLVRAEFPKIEKLVLDGDCDYYLFFTAWKLPAGVERELVREIKALGVKDAWIIAAETLTLLIDEYPEIQSWIWEKLDAPRTRSLNRIYKLRSILRNQDGLTQNILGFMHHAFGAATLRSSELISPVFEAVETFSHREHEIFNLKELAAKLEFLDNTVVIEGQVGAGKSIAAKMLVQERLQHFAEMSLDHSVEDYWLPIYVTGKMIDDDWNTLSSLIEQAMMETDHNNWRVIVDGFDEIRDHAKRARLIDFSESLLKSETARLGFLIFSRPNAISIDAKAKIPNRYVITAADQQRALGIIKVHANEEHDAESILGALQNVLDIELLTRPLFIAIATYVITHELGSPNSKFDLVDFFVDDVLRRAQHKFGFQAEALNAELEKLIEDKKSDQGSVRRRGSRVLEESDSKLKALLSSGLVENESSGLRFSHEFFRHYFHATVLSRKHEPTLKVWEKIDPFKVGWETASLLCECWDAQGKDVSDCLQALSRFLGKGQDLAYELAAICNNVDEETRYVFASNILRNCEELGELKVTEAQLSGLAVKSQKIRDLLIKTGSVYRYEIVEDTRVLAARCLATFDLVAATELFEKIAFDRREYCGQRIEAAKELLKGENSYIGLEALRELSIEAEGYQSRFEAAVLALEFSNCDEDRQLVSEVIAKYHPPEKPYDYMLGKAARLGFGDFSIPLIKAEIEEILLQHEQPKTSQRFSDLWEFTYCCETLSSIGLPKDVIGYCERLLSCTTISNEQVPEILSAMKKMGFSSEMELLLKDEAIRKRLSASKGSATFNFFAEIGEKEKSVEISLEFLRQNLTKRTELHNCANQVEKLIAQGKQEHVIEIVESLSPNLVKPSHLEMLALCGKRMQVKDNLEQGQRFWSMHDQIKAAKLLDKIGFRDTAFKKLDTLSADLNLDPLERMDAALALYKLDKSQVSVLEKCINAARSDVLILAQVLQRVIILEDEAFMLSLKYFDLAFEDHELSDKQYLALIKALARGSFQENFDTEDLFDEVCSFLVNTKDPVFFAECVSEFHWRDDIWGVHDIVVERLTKDASLWTLEIVRTICRDDKLRVDLKDPLLAFCASDRCDFETEISALKSLFEEEQCFVALKQLTKISERDDVPVIWRLNAAGLERDRNASWSWKSSKFKNEEQLLQLATDTRSTPECRYEAILSLGDRSGRLRELSKLFDQVIGFSSSLSIRIIRQFKDLGDAAKIDGAVSELIAQDTDSLSGIEELAELCNFLELFDLERRVCEMALNLSDHILEWTEDVSSIPDLARRIHCTHNRQTALKFLQAGESKNRYADSARSEFKLISIALNSANQSLSFEEMNTPNERTVEAENIDFFELQKCEKQIRLGDFGTLPILRNIVFSKNAQFDMRVRAIEILHLCPSEHFSDTEIDERIDEIFDEVCQSEINVDDALRLAECLLIIKRRTVFIRLVEGLNNVAMRDSDRINFAKLLDRAKLAEKALQQLDKVTNFTCLIWPWNWKFFEEKFGSTELLRKLNETLEAEGTPMEDRVELLGDAISRFGPKSAVNFLESLANSDNADVYSLLRLAEFSYESGDLNKAVAFFEKARVQPDPDYYWLADFAYRYLGRKKFAKKILAENLNSFDEGYRNQVAGLLADLQMDKQLYLLDQRMSNKTIH
ncbi:MAG TPA: hypothetical protein DCS30_09770 [Rhizobiales bacterium]|nr:hypothetical protein [Hyphomicrobiales bacterium]